MQKPERESERQNQTKRPAATGMPHVEIFRGTTHGADILVACRCLIGVDHSYAEGVKYVGPVDPGR